MDGLPIKCSTCNSSVGFTRNGKCKFCGVYNDLDRLKTSSFNFKESKPKLPKSPKVKKPKKTKEDKRQNKSKYFKHKLANDIEFKLAHALRSRLCRAIKNNQKVGSSITELGCSVSEFKTYIEALWKPGMTWDNWSRSGWHIDHIVPLASFDLKDISQFKKACHYTNLQPLWAMENRKKGARHGSDRSSKRV